MYHCGVVDLFNSETFESLFPLTGKYIGCKNNLDTGLPFTMGLIWKKFCEISCINVTKSIGFKCLKSVTFRLIIGIIKISYMQPVNSIGC